MTDDRDGPTVRERLERFADRHPDATAVEAIGAIDELTPTDRDLAESVLQAYADAEQDSRQAGAGTDRYPTDSNTDSGCGVTNESADADRRQAGDRPATSDTDSVESGGNDAATAGFSDENPHPSTGETADCSGSSGSEPAASARARSSRNNADESLGQGDTSSVRHTSPAGDVDDSLKKDHAEDVESGPTTEDKSGETATWDAAAFDAPETDVYPSTLLEREQWMGRQGKLPFAPWADRDADISCTNPDHEPDTVAECECDARWKWGHRGNYVDGETVALAEDDPRLDGRVFLQRDADPFAFVDGDDVRDPETGDIHPAFLDVLDALGLTYADVSSSGAGVHAYYRGDLPDDPGQAVFEIDTEPWGANDDPPTVEIYANKHVCVATGEHVPNTPIDVREWDTDALDAVLDEYLDPEDRRPDDVDHDTDRERDDLEGYDADTTGADETTDEIRDVLYAVDRLRPSDLPLRTRQVGTDATGWEQWDPSSYRTSSGNDSLHKPAGEPVFHDHKHGESFGVLSLFAAEEGILSKPWHRLDGGDWWDAVDAAREAGAPIPEYDGGDDVNADHTPVLPETDALDTATSGWDWKHAATEDATLSIDDARERTKAAIADAYESGDYRLVEALPTMGKSYGAVAAAAEADEPVTIVTGRGQKEQYGQLKEWCDEHGLTYKVLPSFTEDCPTAAGDHGAEWRERVMGWYRRGATPQAIHKFAEDVLGRPLPCQVDDDGNHHDCPYAHTWNFDPETDGSADPNEDVPIDVLIGHYTHAYKEKVTTGRTVVFDEFPDAAYETTLSGGVLQGAISYWLSTVDAVPFDDYTDLIENRDDDARRADALAWFLSDGGELALEVDETHVFDDDSAHATAPLATFAILAGEDLGNGFETADLDDVGTAAFDRANGQVSILQPPALEYASGVVALDGTPTKRMWELSLGVHLNRRDVLASDDEKREYVEDALNLNLVRTTEYVKPYNSADHVTVDRDAALLEGIAETHGQRPALITSSTAEAEYDAAGVLDLVDETKHYGNVLGSNRFRETRLGAVIGSNHYGDHFIKKWGAYAGQAVEREDSTSEGKGAALSYSGFGDDVLTHMREHDTLQAAMRFGRDGNGAVVYVHTDTLPEWVPIAGEGRVVSTWSDGMKGVLDAVDDLGEATAAEIAAHPAVDVGQRQVLDHLESLRERDVLDRQQDPDDGRRCLWRDDGVGDLGEHGETADLDVVDFESLDDGTVHELARSSSYTWEFVNRDAATPTPTVSDADRGAPGADRATIEGDPPPDAD